VSLGVGGPASLNRDKLNCSRLGVEGGTIALQYFQASLDGVLLDPSDAACGRARRVWYRGLGACFFWA
jgi:hypothetical protein